MFKTDPGFKAFSNIKNSERRRTLDDICEEFNIPKDKITTECEREFMPAVVKASGFKTVNKVSGEMFTDTNGVPIWFYVEKLYVPTVYTLWKCPFLIPMIYTHDAVISRLLAGANLMLPGTLPPFDPRLKPGKVVAVGNIDNPNVAIAVGICLMDLENVHRVVGSQGVVVRILHYLEDEVFKMPRKEIKMPLSSEVVTEMTFKPEEELIAEAPEEEEANDADVVTGKETGVGEETDGEEAISQGDVVQMEEEQSVSAQEDAPVMPTAVDEEVSDDEDKEDPVSELVDNTYKMTIEDVDEFFIRSLLQSITQDKIDLPITSSNFMANHILKNLPQVDPKTVNMKKTSWKKSAKFLKAMEKLQLLKVKGKGDDLTVTSLANKDHERVKRFEPYKIKKAVVGEKSNAEKEKEAAKSNQLQVIQYYKPTSVSKNLLREIDCNPDGYYTAQEVKKCLATYISLKKLENSKNKKQLYLNDVIKPIVTTPKELKGLVPGVAVYKDRVQVSEAFMSNGFSPYHAIVKPGEDPKSAKIARGPVPKITIIEEMRIGRKVVTRVFGFEGFHIRDDDLSDELKVKCSGSTTIGKNPQQPKFIEVMVQGAHFKTVSEVLMKKGIKPAWIEHENKVKPKKKKPAPH